jgi:hypothetical protein
MDYVFHFLKHRKIKWACLHFTYCYHCYLHSTINLILGVKIVGNLELIPWAEVLASWLLLGLKPVPESWSLTWTSLDPLAMDFADSRLPWRTRRTSWSVENFICRRALLVNLLNWERQARKDWPKVTKSIIQTNTNLTAIMPKRWSNNLNIEDADAKPNRIYLSSSKLKKNTPINLVRFLKFWEAHPNYAMVKYK